jgi:hypothetical protein
MAAKEKAAKAAPKTETPAKTPKDSAAKAEGAAAAEPSKTDSGEKPSEKPANYSRGEGQKVVTQAYRDNWNAIFGKKKKR